MLVVLPRLAKAALIFYNYLILYVCSDHDGKKKVEIEDYKSRVKPRTIWDKPDITDQTNDSIVLKWKESSTPQYAVQTAIWYVVEQRMPPSLEWVKIVTDCKETEFKVCI